MRFRDSTSLKVPISLAIQANLNGVAMWLSERAEKHQTSIYQPNDFADPLHRPVQSAVIVPMTSQAEGGQKQVFDTPARSLTIDWTVAPAITKCEPIWLLDSCKAGLVSRGTSEQTI